MLKWGGGDRAEEWLEHTRRLEYFSLFFKYYFDSEKFSSGMAMPYLLSKA
jgi:hypothetical protein